MAVRNPNPNVFLSSATERSLYPLFFLNTPHTKEERNAERERAQRAEKREREELLPRRRCDRRTATVQLRSHCRAFRHHQSHRRRLWSREELAVELLCSAVPSIEPSPSPLRHRRRGLHRRWRGRSRRRWRESKRESEKGRERETMQQRRKGEVFCHQRHASSPPPPPESLVAAMINACLNGATGGVMLLPEPPRGVARNRPCPASAILRFNIHWPGAVSAFRFH
ncbi:uncharacterized protein LOC130974914 [Arachis stenosperma]|uniref:uncharacterized protein LOC130974914 n=1 Tax=Arachis stenosperma TaxID=217475 RepID=UPI0025AD954E|nr:uncharacterized protein LOC130974914 [Arachis stenosperma]